MDPHMDPHLDPHLDRTRSRKPDPRRRCIVAACENFAAARQMCRKHYQRWYTGSDPHTSDHPTRHHAVCQRPGCGQPTLFRRSQTPLCKYHYRQQYYTPVRARGAGVAK